MSDKPLNRVIEAYTDKPYRCYDFEIKSTKAGSHYLQFRMQDTKKIYLGRMWNWNISNQMPQDDKVYMLSGQLQSYNGSISFVANSIPQLTNINPAEFSLHCINTTQAVELIGKLKETISNISNPIIKKLLYAVFNDLGLYKSDINEVLNTRLVTTPAAVLYHHCGWGGWLLHTSGVVSKAQAMSNGYALVDMDIVTAGALLHDIGKLESYQESSGSYSRTFKDKLIGHLALGISFLDKYRNEENDRLITLLQHIIACHHGKPEYGSIKEPLFIEGMIVINADLGDCIEFYLKEINQELVSSMNLNEMSEDDVLGLLQKKVCNLGDGTYFSNILTRYFTVDSRDNTMDWLKQ